MAKKKSNKKAYASYREIPRSEVEKYADKKQLSIETSENFREAAQELFANKYAPKKKNKSMNFDIKISGSGTPEEIVEALEGIVKDIRGRSTDNSLDGAEWEDATLMTEISAE